MTTTVRSTRTPRIRPLLAALLLALAPIGSAQEPLPVLDLGTCTPTATGFSWALGSVHFEIAGPEGEGCRFTYFWEIEAGYQIHDCLAPRDLGSFALDADAYRPPFHEEGWGVDKAIAPHCTFVRSGNLLQEGIEDAQEK
jgi:hypothetical protein